LPVLRREFVFLEGHADRDEAEGFGELLQEGYLDLAAVLAAVGHDVLLEGWLREGVVEILVNGRDPERRLPVVLRQRERRALSVVVRAQDDERRGPAVGGERRVAVGRDRAGVDIARMRNHQTDEVAGPRRELWSPTGSERVGVAFLDLAEP